MAALEGFSVRFTILQNFYLRYILPHKEALSFHPYRFIVNKIHELDTSEYILYSTIKQEQIVRYFPCLPGSYPSILMIPCHSVCSRLQTSKGITSISTNTHAKGLCILFFARFSVFNLFLCR